MSESRLDRAEVLKIIRRTREEKEKTETKKFVDSGTEPESESDSMYETPSEGLYADYQFPTLSELEPYLKKFRLASKEQLLRKIKEKSKAKVKVDTSYWSSRLEYCSINIVLNELGIIAPSFRPFRKLTSNKLTRVNDVVLSRDRQVLDLHYLHCQHHDDFLPTDSEFEALATDDEFDFKLAAQFALKKWKGETKVHALQLSDFQMYELAIFRTKSISDHIGNMEYDTDEPTEINPKKNKIRLKLTNWTNLDTSRSREEDIDLRIEEYRCLRLAKGSISSSVRFWNLRGNSIPVGDHAVRNFKSSMSKRKKWFESKLGIRFDR